MPIHSRLLAVSLLATATWGPIACAQDNETTRTAPPTTAAHETGRLRFINPAHLAPPTGYTHVVEAPAAARTLYISGQIAFDEQGKLVGRGDFAAQAEQVFANLDTALKAAGASFDNVVRLNYYVTDMSHLAALRKARDTYVHAGHLPAGTLVQVDRLSRDGLMLEVDATAVVVAQ